jgi:hypothetical protein
MRLWTRIWFWLMAIPLLAVSSFAISFALFSGMDRLLQTTSMNIWGDMAGLIVPVWIGAVVLFVLEVVVLVRFILSASGASGSVGDGDGS